MMNMMGDAKMFIRYPLNLEEEQKNLMITIFHNTNLSGQNNPLFLFSFCPYVSVTTHIYACYYPNISISSYTNKHTTFTTPII